MKNTHLPHIEDLIFDGQFMQAIDTLYAIIDGLKGTLRYPQHLKVSTKYDGAPAIVFGRHPKTRRFFVGTKSVFNKRIPKIIFQREDADHHYGDKPDLASKMEHIWDCLQFACGSGMIPSGGIYQADLMYIQDDVEYSNRIVSFTPNTLTYNINDNHPVVYDIKQSMIGMVVHTRYEGSDMLTLEARSDIDQSRFFNGREVCWINPDIDIGNHGLTVTQISIINDALTYVENTWRDLPVNVVSTHGPMLKMFINHCIRIGEGKPSMSMYHTFLMNRDNDLLLSDAKVYDKDIRILLVLHHYLKMVKNIIIDALSVGSLFYTEVNDIPCKGEGFVITYHGVPVKLVDRMEFSRNNFANKRFEKVNNG